MLKIINWGIIANPLNWLTIVLMLMIVSFLADAVIRRVQAENSTGPSISQPPSS